MIDIRNLSKKQGDQYIFRDISLRVEGSTIIALLGASGSGKTSFLRMIAGLSRPCSGEIRIAGKRVSTPFKVVSPDKRHISMVFQSLALWPHMTVQKHLEFVSRKLPFQSKNETLIYIKSLLDRMHLGAYAHRYPRELSGGEQQRLAIARALASRPEYLLMDEPFSHLDDILRQELMELTISIKKKRGITILYVTHHIDEALYIADKIVIMRNGSIHKIPNIKGCQKSRIIEQMKGIP